MTNEEHTTPSTELAADDQFAVQPSKEQAWSDADIERLRSMIGGKTGLADGAIPAVLFVVANAVWGLTTAAIAATAYGASMLAYRAFRRQKIRHALYGLIGLTISVGIALITRNPSAYFAPGAAWGAISGVLFLLTAIFKQPVSTMFAMALEKKPKEYYERREVLRMHIIVTSAWGGVMLGKSLFRAYLIANDQTELLGASAIFLGYPLTVALAAGSVMYLRRGSKNIPQGEQPAPSNPSGPAEPATETS